MDTIALSIEPLSPFLGDHLDALARVSFLLLDRELQIALHLGLYLPLFLSKSVIRLIERE
jgi:hypothetical protein